MVGRRTIKITKRIIHRVTGYPTLDWPKILKSDSKEVIEKNMEQFGIREV